MELQTIFLSYSWNDRELAEKIDNDFSTFGIRLVRDIRETSFTNSIRQFMKRVRKSDFVLMLVSDAYLRSPNCMYEVLEFVKDEDFRDRLLPLLAEDFGLLSAPRQLEYVKYWVDRYKAFKKSLAEAGLEPEQSLGQAEHSKMLQNIASSVGEFLAILASMLMFRVDDLTSPQYTEIFRRVGLNPARIILHDLQACEEKLYACRLTKEIAPLQRKRLEIMAGLAGCGSLEALLARRYAFRISTEVAGMVRQVLSQPERLEVTSIPAQDFQRMADLDVDELDPVIQGSSEYFALYAAHLALEKWQRAPGAMPSERLIVKLLESDLPYRLSIAAEMIRTLHITVAAKPLGAAVRRFIDSVGDRASADAWASLSQVLEQLDVTTYNRHFMVAHYVFLRLHPETARPYMYPLLELHSEVYPTSKDYSALLASGDRMDSMAAIWMLSLKGLGTTQTAQRNPAPVTLSPAARHGIDVLCDSQLDIQERWRLCNAIVMCNLDECRGWVRGELHRTDGAATVVTINDPIHGAYDEPHLALFLRAYGYLSRILRESGGPDADMVTAAELMREQWRKAVVSGSRGLMAGAAVGRGYLGDWRPILKMLSPNEPWLHEAALAIVKLWVDDPAELREIVDWVAEESERKPEVDGAIRLVRKRVAEEAERKLAQREALEW